MDDCAPPFGAIHQCNIFLDAIVGLYFESPPVGPERTADAVLRELVGNLVGLHAMMKGAYPITKFVGHIQNGEHFVSAITMHVNDDVAAKRTCERFQFEVPLGW